jgi:hypothetical protein
MMFASCGATGRARAVLYFGWEFGGLDINAMPNPAM